MKSADEDVHIASLVVQHRAEAADGMAAHIAGSADMELALRGEFRSVVLCECDNQYAVLDRIETLRSLPGVLNVSLVYHHAEPGESLDAPVSPVSKSGGLP